MKRVMKQQQEDVALGRFLSLVLRHNPAAAGIRLDQNGWADVEALLAGVRRSGRQIDRAVLERIVEENNKKRYQFNDDHTRIRACQGHSVAVDVELKRQEPPDLLYHGTAAHCVAGIMEQGITRQTRQHVHLAADEETAEKVGRRHGKPVILKVNAAAMAKDGYAFFCSDNGVWLCEQVPVQYISVG